MSSGLKEAPGRVLQQEEQYIQKTRGEKEHGVCMGGEDRGSGVERRRRKRKRKRKTRGRRKGRKRDFLWLSQLPEP